MKWKNIREDTQDEIKDPGRIYASRVFAVTAQPYLPAYLTGIRRLS